MRRQIKCEFIIRFRSLSSLVRLHSGISNRLGMSRVADANDSRPVLFGFRDANAFPPNANVPSIISPAANHTNVYRLFIFNWVFRWGRTHIKSILSPRVPCASMWTMYSVWFNLSSIAVIFRFLWPPLFIRHSFEFKTRTRSKHGAARGAQRNGFSRFVLSLAFVRSVKSRVCWPFWFSHSRRSSTEIAFASARAHTQMIKTKRFN